MIGDMRWIVTLLAITAAALAIALIATLAGRQAGDPGQQRFLQWETCVLNDGARCGPQPIP